MTPDITKALAIEGWMQPAELTWLAEQAATRKAILEVGSWMGRSTRALCDNTLGQVCAVDTWKGSGEPKHVALLADKDPDWLFNQFKENMHGVQNLTALRFSSLVAAANFIGLRPSMQPQFDMIFLDAAHDYDNVDADIQAWKPFLVPGGLMCGHDFGGPFAGVTRAVMTNYPKAHKAGAGSIWVSE